MHIRLVPVVLSVALAGCAASSRLDRADLAGTADLAGQPDLTPAPVRVAVNEVFPHGSDPTTDPDWAEIMNLGAATADLSGWKVRDSASMGAVLPPGTQVPPGGFLVLSCDDTTDGGAPGGLHVPFKLSGKGDEFHLARPDGTEVDVAKFDGNDVATDRSWGRIPDGTGAFTETKLTRGAANKK